MPPGGWLRKLPGARPPPALRLPSRPAPPGSQHPARSSSVHAPPALPPSSTGEGASPLFHFSRRAISCVDDRWMPSHSLWAAFVENCNWNDHDGRTQHNERIRRSQQCSDGENGCRSRKETFLRQTSSVRFAGQGLCVPGVSWFW